MTLKELKKKVATETGHTIKEIDAIMTTFEKVVRDTIVTEDVKIMDGVVLTRVYSPERVGRNPKTGEELKIAAKYNPKCKFGKAFKEAVNQ